MLTQAFRCVLCPGRFVSWSRHCQSKEGEDQSGGLCCGGMDIEKLRSRGGKKQMHRAAYTQLTAAESMYRNSQHGVLS
jgi:hypothetical protein